jgi:hypothetical protein
MDALVPSKEVAIAATLAELRKALRAADSVIWDAMLQLIDLALFETGAISETEYDRRTRARYPESPIHPPTPPPLPSRNAGVTSLADYRRRPATGGKRASSSVSPTTKEGA